VWDWSDRFLRIERHLRDISQHHENQTRVAPAWLMQGIAERVHYYSKNA
jgi:hypothetical protein